MMEALEGTYCGPAPLPADIWLRWNLDPVLLLALCLLTLAVGRNRAGGLAVAVLALAFVSPLCALSAALFSARVVHHILLVAVAAPLLALAWPGRSPRSPAAPFLVSTGVLWAWHWPPAYDLALSNVVAYWAMQATLLGSAFAFWQAVLHRGQAAGTSLLWVLGGYMQMALLGALLTFAPKVLYAIHAVAPVDWGFTPLGDQQLGGLIMWVPAGLPFVAWGALVARRGWQAVAKGLA
ncbi:cytochrome c oxidase assembly protein [Pseudaminobacter sp. 19-2017]|uniref:Cytochrome c oxidase assembly protein n=1 Tax=Pseudaminobacter soli (ex Zhang et al. 2022) TaxID=2831468 RepID=A0A942IB19_9HYPH|nr:cytochrome c oxidase assembly protein [Pseudaminobacter soli]MBS3651845.1 cytochrome c oxidase assembly protein [Pseudaminobacter soli]